MQDTVEQHLRKEQVGFCKHRSCVDLINTLRIILEQSVEWQAILYETFIDFEQAFNSAKTEVMWLTLQYTVYQGKLSKKLRYFMTDLNAKSPMKGSFLNLCRSEME